MLHFPKAICQALRVSFSIPIFMAPFVVIGVEIIQNGTKIGDFVIVFVDKLAQNGAFALVIVPYEATFGRKLAQFICFL